MTNRMLGFLLVPLGLAGCTLLIEQGSDVHWDCQTRVSELDAETADALIDDLWPALTRAIRWIDQFGDSDGDAFGDIVGDEKGQLPYDKINDEQLKQEVEGLLDKLSRRERDILKFRYGLRGAKVETLEVVGRRFKITRERVRQIQNSAVRKLRTMLDESDQPAARTAKENPEP